MIGKARLNFVAPDPSRHATSFSRDEAHAREPGRQLEKVLQDGGIRPEHVTVRDARGADGPGGEGSLQDEGRMSSAGRGSKEGRCRHLGAAVGCCWRAAAMLLCDAEALPLCPCSHGRRPLRPRG